jgi:hypothetical protein
VPVSSQDSVAVVHFDKTHIANIVCAPRWRFGERGNHHVSVHSDPVREDHQRVWQHEFAVVLRAGLIAQRIPARPFELEQDVPHRVFRHASLSTQNRRTGPPAKLRVSGQRITVRLQRRSRRGARCRDLGRASVRVGAAHIGTSNIFTSRENL